MSEETPPLPDDIRSLLDVESELTPAPEGAKGRVHAQVLASIGAFPGGGGGGGGGGPTNGGAGGGFALSSVATHLLTFVLGAGAAVAVFAATTPRAEPPRVVYVDRPVPAASAAAPEPAVAVTPYTLPAAPSAEPTASPSASSRAEVSEDRQLAREREMLDVARTALGRGDAADALAAIDKHARRYPTGLLVQEREAMAVQALLLAGRPDQARARGQRFMQQYPDSVLGPAVSTALSSIP